MPAPLPTINVGVDEAERDSSASLNHDRPDLEPPQRTTSHNSMGDRHPAKIRLTYSDAFALLVSLQIGSGVFSSPSQVDKHTAAPGFALLVWLFSGLLAWAGAISFAELGAAVPVNGGMQEYLRYIYGDLPAFMASWIWIWAVKPSSMAVLAIIFSQYWLRAIFGETMARNGWQTKLLAILAHAVVVLCNTVSLSVTTRLNRFFLWLKLATVAILAFCALLAILFRMHLGEGTPSADWRDRGWFHSPGADSSLMSWESLGQTTLALYAGLWAFAGWDNANMVAGEMADPKRDLPLAINTAEPVVISSFMVANACYYLVLPWSAVKTSNAVATLVGNEVLGRPGALVFAVLVSLACIGSINVNVFTTSRLTVTAAEVRWLPAKLAEFGVTTSCPSLPRERSSSSWQTPIKAMLLNTASTWVYIVLGTFGTLVTFIGIAEYAFFCLTALGLLILRFREPDLHRPYKPNILIPAIFFSASLLLVLRGSIQAPVQAVVLVTLSILGYLRRWWASSSRLHFGTASSRPNYEAVPME